MMMSLSTAIILAGGEGTRLRPMTKTRPKPLLRVANLPMIEQVIIGLKEQGIRRFALAIGYKHEQIEEYFGDGQKWGVEIRHFVENEPQGSGGALKFVYERAPEYFEQPFLVVTADVLHNADLMCAYALHRHQNALATIVCAHADDPHGFGIVEMEEDGRVTHFLEKPEPHETTSRWANLAVWIFEPQILERIAPGFSQVETSLFPQMLSKSEPIFAFRHEGYWLDVGTLPRYLQAQNDALNHRFPCNDGPIDFEISDNAIVKDSVLYEDAVVEAKAQVRRCIIGPHQRVRAGEKIADRVLWPQEEEEI